MQKTLQTLLSISFIALLLSTASAQQSFTIYWNSNHMYDAYQAEIDAFAAENNLDIKIETFLWPDMTTRLLADFSAGTAPDLIEVPAGWTADFGTKNLLKPLNDELAAWEDSSDWFDSTWPEVTVGDDIFGVKLHHTSLGFFYNKDLLKAAGLEPVPPATLQELRDYAKTVTENLGPEVLGFGFDADPGYFNGFFATENNPSLIKDNKVTLDSPEVIEALTILQEIASSGWALLPEPGASYQSSRRAFFEGKTAMMISGPWDLATLASDAPDMDYGIAAVPVLEGLASRPPAAGTAVAIPAAAKNADLAWQLIQRLTSVEVETAATIEAGMLMPRKTWAESEEVLSLPRIADFVPLVEAATPFDLEANRLGLSQLVGTGDVYTEFFQNIIYNRVTPEVAVEQYAREANQLIERKTR